MLLSKKNYYGTPKSAYQRALNIFIRRYIKKVDPDEFIAL
jgi:hypothetical protein